MATQTYSTKQAKKVGDTFKTANGKVWTVTKVEGPYKGTYFVTATDKKQKNPSKGTWIKVKAIKFLGGGKIQVLK